MTTFRVDNIRVKYMDEENDEVRFALRVRHFSFICVFFFTFPRYHWIHKVNMLTSFVDFIFNLFFVPMQTEELDSAVKVCWY